MEIRHTRKDKEIVGESNTLFSLIYAMLLLSDDFDIVDEFIKNISILISDYNEVKLEHLGFPEDWEKVLTRRSQERAGFLMSLNST
jgi:abortive infection bacteriophage resistance protein